MERGLVEKFATGQSGLVMEDLKTTIEAKYLRRSFDIIQLETYDNEYLAAAKGLVKRDGIILVRVRDIAFAREVIEKAGFFVFHIEIDEKKNAVICATPEAKVENVVLYGPPGVGDILWTLNKIEAIRKREAPCRINYHVCCAFGPEKEGQRSADFLGLCGLIDSYSFSDHPLPYGDICPDVTKPEYNLFANPHIDMGKAIADWHTELDSNYDIKFELPDSVLMQVTRRMKGVKYATVYFSSSAWNRECTFGQAWTPADWAEICVYIADKGIKPVLLGAYWDKSYADQVAEDIAYLGRNPSDIWINMTSKTTMLLALAFMKMAEFNIGSGSSGLTISSAYLGNDCMTFWPKPHVLLIEPPICDKIRDGFSTAWMPDKIMQLGRYKPLHFGEFTRDDVIQYIDTHLEKSKCNVTT